VKKVYKIFGIIIGSAIFVSVLVTVIWYKNIQPLEFNYSKHIDLCVADDFFKSRINKKYDPFTNERIQVKWDIPVKQFWNADTITFSITNITGVKLYYLGFKNPCCDFVFFDYIIAPQGRVDTLYFHKLGFDGVDNAEYIPFKKKGSITLKHCNPLLFYPEFDIFLPMDTDEFPRIIKEVYGDTAQIRFFVFLRGLPWNNSGFSIAYSDFIKVPIDSIIDGWKKGRFTNHMHYNPEIHQEYLNVREEIMKERNRK